MSIDNNNKNITRCDRQQLEIICVDEHLKKSRTCGTGEIEANPITLGPLEHISAPNLCREFPFLYFGEKTLSVDRKPYSKCVKWFCLVSFRLAFNNSIFFFFYLQICKLETLISIYQPTFTLHAYDTCSCLIKLWSTDAGAVLQFLGLFITHIVNITSITGCLIYGFVPKIYWYHFLLLISDLSLLAFILLSTRNVFWL